MGDFVNKYEEAPTKDKNEEEKLLDKNYKPARTTVQMLQFFRTLEHGNPTGFVLS